MGIEFALHPACAPEGMLTVMQNYVSCNPWPRNAFIIHTACDLSWVPKIFQFISPFPTVYIRHAQILHKCSSQLKIPSARWVTRARFHTQNPQLLVATVPSSVARATWCAVFMCPWFLLREFKCDVISRSLIAASWTPSRYVESLLLFSERQPSGLS